VLDTAAIGAGNLLAQKLPANFGVGRGNWTAQLLAGVTVQLRYDDPLSPADIGAVRVMPLVFDTDNFSIVVKNMSSVIPDSLDLVLHFDHTMVR
jgi:hypothetical protein